MSVMDSSEGVVGVIGPCSAHASEIGSSCNIRCKCGKKSTFIQYTYSIIIDSLRKHSLLVS